MMNLLEKSKLFPKSGKHNRHLLNLLEAVHDSCLLP